jgi:hypothetical protein
MTPDITEIDRPAVPSIGKIKCEHITYGTWFLGRMEPHGESALFVKVYDDAVDIIAPMNTYGKGTMFYDVREVAVKIDFWKL